MVAVGGGGNPISDPPTSCRALESSLFLPPLRYHNPVLQWAGPSVPLHSPCALYVKRLPPAFSFLAFGQRCLKPAWGLNGLAFFSPFFTVIKGEGANFEYSLVNSSPLPHCYRTITPSSNFRIVLYFAVKFANRIVAIRGGELSPMDRASALLCKLGQYCRSWCAPVWNGPVCLRLPAGLADLGMLQSASVYSSFYLPLRHQNTTSRTLHIDQAPHFAPTTLYSAPYPRKSAGFRHQSLGSKSGSIAGMECWLWRS